MDKVHALTEHIKLPSSKFPHQGSRTRKGVFFFTDTPRKGFSFPPGLKIPTDNNNNNNKGIIFPPKVEIP